VVWAYAGVRSLYDDGAAKPEDATRDYQLTLDDRHREAPLLTIYGGKITTYRKLAEAAMAKLLHFFAASAPGNASWTAHAPLPGGDIVLGDIETLIAQMRRARPLLPESLVRRLVRAYGTRIDRVIGEAKSFEDLGTCFGADLTAAEVRYLMAHEWAQDADDVLWRRTKLGLRFSSAEHDALSAFMADVSKNDLIKDEASKNKAAT
jgi:glycerol-3-phosphate dehydrogenase